MSTTSNEQQAPPRHRYEVEVRTGANTVEELADELRRVAYDLELRDARGNGDDPWFVVGSHRIINLTVDTGVTAESFDRDLQAWAARRKEQRAAASPAPGATGSGA